MRLKICLMILILALLVLPTGSAKGAEDQFTVNYSAWYLDYPSEGSQSVTLIITNITGKTLDMVVSSWWDFYIYSDKSYSWIDPSWCTRINPTSQTLLPGESMISNVEFTLPAGLPDAKWITWIKVTDGTLEKPVVVALRKGTAIPKYDYSTSPGDYLLDITGYGASVIVDDPTDSKAPPIIVKNKTNTTCLFMAELVECPQQKDSPEGITIISANSGLQHTPDEVGLKLTNISYEEAKDWITFSATEAKPLEIEPRLTRMINWSMNVPDSLPDGNYIMLVVIKPAADLGVETGQTGISTNNGVFLRLRVDRKAEDKGFGLGYWPLVGIGGLLVVVGLGYVIVSKVKGKSDTKLPEYRTLGRG